MFIVTWQRVYVAVRMVPDSVDSEYMCTLLK